MELDDLKSIWKNELQEEARLNKHSEEQLIKIMEKTANPTLELKKLSKKHLNRGILIFCTLLFVQLQRFWEGRITTSYVLLMVLYALSCVAIYYLQFQIFNIKADRESLKKTLEYQMIRFKDFLKVFAFFSLTVVPVFVYLIMEHYQLMKAEHNLLFTIALTLLMNIDTYFRYKKTYWKWIREIEMTLRELETE